MIVNLLEREAIARARLAGRWVSLFMAHYARHSLINCSCNIPKDPGLASQ